MAGRAMSMQQAKDSAKILKDLPWDDMSRVVDNWMETDRVKYIVASIGASLGASTYS
jgi:hypothetical protein